MDILTIVMWIVILIAVGMGVWYVVAMFRLPYQVRIREMTSNQVRLIHDTTAKINKDEDGIEFLKLTKAIGEIKEIPLPPKEAIDYNPKKKKKVIECWYSDEEGITYITDEGVVTGFQPLTTKQRQMMVSQIRKKEARKTKRWQDNIPLIVSAASLIIIVTVVLIFWGDAIAPIQSAAATSESAIKHADQLWERIIAYDQGRQIIVPEGEPP